VSTASSITSPIQSVTAAISRVLTEHHERLFRTAREPGMTDAELLREAELKAIAIWNDAALLARFVQDTKLVARRALITELKKLG